MRWLSRLFYRRKQDAELDSELRFHVEQQTADNIAVGMPPDEARRRALAQFGGLEYIKEETREARGTQFIDTLLQDIRFALRMLRKSPGFTAVAVLTLALGIGANTAIFTFINVVLLRPLPGITSPNTLVTIGRTDKGQGFDTSSYANYRDLRDQNTVFSDVAAVFPLAVSISTKGRADRIDAILVTSNYFRTLGVHFARGRGFVESSDLEPGASPEVVISYHLWVERFGNDRDIVGKTVAVDGVPMTVTGVAAPGFIGTDPTSAADAWIPMSAGRRVLPSWLDMDEWVRHLVGIG